MGSHHPTTLVILTPDQVTTLVREAVREELASRRDQPHDLGPVDTVAEELGIGARRLRGLVQAGTVEGSYAGRRLLASRSSARSWVADHDRRRPRPTTGTGTDTEDDDDDDTDDDNDVILAMMGIRRAG